jgi:hypothetical protein
MLVHLATYLTIMLAACTTMLLICWFRDTASAPKAPRTHALHPALWGGRR